MECMDHRWNGDGYRMAPTSKERMEHLDKQASKPASTNGNTFPSPVEWRMGKSSPVGWGPLGARLTHSLIITQPTRYWSIWGRGERNYIYKWKLTHMMSEGTWSWLDQRESKEKQLAGLWENEELADKVNPSPRMRKQARPTGEEISGCYYICNYVNSMK